MNKEEYAIMNYLLGKIRYELIKMKFQVEENSKSYQQIEKELKDIENVSKICIIGDSNV